MSNQPHFTSSEEAEAYIAQVRAMLTDPRLEHWARESDENYGANSQAHLTDTIVAFGKFEDEVLYCS